MNKLNPNHGMGWNKPDELHDRLVEISKSYSGYVMPENKGMWKAMFEEIEKSAAVHTAKAVASRKSVQIEERIVDVRDVQMIVDAYRRDLLRELGYLVKKLQTDLDSPPEVFSRRGGLIDAMTLVERPWDKRYIAPVLVGTVPINDVKEPK